MKKTFKQTLAAVAMGALLVAVVACGKDNPEPTPAGNDTDEQAAKIAARFVDYTVAPTYSALARQTEQLAARLLRQPKQTPASTGLTVDYCAEVGERLSRSLGRKVKLVDGKKTGRIVLEFYGADDREALIEALEKLLRQ